MSFSNPDKKSKIETRMAPAGTRLAKVARLFAGNTGLQVLFAEHECKTDMNGVIVLPLNTPEMLERGGEEAELVWYHLDHEKGHCATQSNAAYAKSKHRKFHVNADIRALVTGRSSAIAMNEGAAYETLTSLLLKMQEFNAWDRSYTLWFNVFEDIRNDKQEAARYPGIAARMDFGHSYQARKWTERLTDPTTAGKYDAMSLASIQIILGSFGAELPLPQAARDAVIALKPYIDLIPGMENIADSYNLALAVHDAIAEATPTAPPPPPEAEPTPSKESLTQPPPPATPPQQVPAPEEADEEESSEEDGTEEASEGEKQEQDEDGEEASGEEASGGSEDTDEDEEASEGEEGEEAVEGGSESADEDGEEGEESSEEEAQASPEEGYPEEQDREHRLNPSGKEGPEQDGYAETAGFANDPQGKVEVDRGTALSAIKNSYPVLTNPIEQTIEEEIETASRGVAVKNTATKNGEHPYTVADEVSKADRMIKLAKGQTFELESIRKKTKRGAATLSARLRTLLMARSLDRRRSDAERGKLDRRALHRLNRPGHLPAKDIFETKTMGEKQDVAVMVLVDCSASMSGTKFNLAQQGLILLGDTLAQLELLGVKFGAYGFTTTGNQIGYAGSRLEGVVHYQFKGFEDDWRTQGALRAVRSPEMANNADGDSINWAVHELLKVKAARHVLLVLSDGQPICRTNDPYAHKERLSAVVKGAILEGVEVCGIGICSRAVEDYYPVTEVINDIEALPAAIVKMAQRWFSKQVTVAA